jgi:hypothetical protein
MKRIKSAAVALGVAAGLLAVPSAAASASIRPAESVYTLTTMNRCFADQIYAECVKFYANTTYSSTQIWINGIVHCSWSSGSYATVNITWCGVGGGNGTAYLNIGANWNVPSWDANGLYERVDIIANDGNCTQAGNKLPIGDITYWYSQLNCEAAA